jgi:ERF superfamily
MKHMDNLPVNVSKKLFDLQTRVNYVLKEGKMDAGGYGPKYNYVRAMDLIGEVKAAAKEVGLIFVVSHGTPVYDDLKIDKSGGGSRNETRCVITGYITYIDPDSGEQVQFGPYVGEGRDGGDKAPYKAQTGLFKYALVGSLGISTTDDPEKVDKDDREEPEPVRSLRPAVKAEVKQAPLTAQQLMEKPVVEKKVARPNVKLGTDGKLDIKDWNWFWTTVVGPDNDRKIQAKNLQAARPDATPEELAKELA